VLPAAQAAGLVVITAGLVALSWLGTGLVVQVPLATLATVLACRWVVALWSDDGGWLSESAKQLTGIAKTGDGTLGLWRIALTIVGLAPIMAAGWMLLTWGERGRTRRHDDLDD
jgi:hypothetical protein